MLFFGDLHRSHPFTPSPYRETYSTARLDWNGPWAVTTSFACNYNVNSDTSNYGDSYSLYANRDNTPGYAWAARTSHRTVHPLVPWQL